MKIGNLITAVSASFVALLFGGLPNFAIAMPSNLTLANDCPAGQPETSAGCSTCTECCLFSFNLEGCDKPAVLELGTGITTNCQPLEIGMWYAWITECTGWFGECYLWKNPDCTGDGSFAIDNAEDVCHQTDYFIKAIQCFGD